MSNRLDPDQARHFVVPDLGPVCLQRLSAEDTRRKRLNRDSSLLIITCANTESPEEHEDTNSYMYV